jgi:hypothetical protein
MNRTILLLLTLIVITGSALGTYIVNHQKTTQFNAKTATDDQLKAVKMAQEQYVIKAKAGLDTRSGPCLDENLMPDWVADLVHNPRVRSDDQPENECQNFLNGKAKHFVELDLDGNVVRVQ